MGAGAGMGAMRGGGPFAGGDAAGGRGGMMRGAGNGICPLASSAPAS
jgi:hypothetical protein